MNVPNAKRQADAGAMRRRRILTVVGSGKTGDPQCAEVGRLAATLGFDLLTGGGRGVMADVSQAFFEASPRRGLIIGIVPATVEPLDAIEKAGTANRRLRSATGLSATSGSKLRYTRTCPTLEQTER